MLPQDTTRYTYILQMALEVQRGVILTGTSGVGKTRIVQRLMAKEGSMHNVVVNFSAQTSSAATQVDFSPWLCSSSCCSSRHRPCCEID